MCFAKIPDRFLGQNSDLFFAYVVGADFIYVRSSEVCTVFDEERREISFFSL